MRQPNTHRTSSLIALPYTHPKLAMPICNHSQSYICFKCLYETLNNYYYYKLILQTTIPADQYINYPRPVIYIPA